MHITSSRLELPDYPLIVKFEPGGAVVLLHYVKNRMTKGSEALLGCVRSGAIAVSYAVQSLATRNISSTSSSLTRFICEAFCHATNINSSD